MKIVIVALTAAAVLSGVAAGAYSYGQSTRPSQQAVTLKPLRDTGAQTTLPIDELLARFARG